MRLMDEFGVTPELIRDPKTGDPQRIIIPREHYRPTKYAIEPDASNAAYFLAAAAIRPDAQRHNSAVWARHSLQGDVGFADVLRRMGAQVKIETDSVTVQGTDALEGIDIDLSAMPDQAQTLAVVALLPKAARSFAACTRFA